MTRMTRMNTLAGAILAAAAGIGVEAARIAATGAARVGDFAILASLSAVIGLICAWIHRARRREEAARSAERSDAVTGLRSGACLREDLACVMAAGEDRTLAVFDLDGFKKYNDSFGYGCGDSLLARLGRRLGAAAGDHGVVYRRRGDEFCLLLDSRGESAEPVMEACVAALFEVGEGFMIRCSSGRVELPREAGGVADALKLVDARVHADREDPRGASSRELQGALYASITAPRLAPPQYEVAGVAVRVARALGMSSAEVEDVESTAHLRDVGNMAIPDAILHAAGGLDDEGWGFVRHHTVVGERLLDAFDMPSVARLVRSSHERYDGGGYPDGLVGEEIPLGARIVFACSAFQDMTSDRPHRAALSSEQAMAELKKGAGTQFDPGVVDAAVHDLAAASTGGSVNSTDEDSAGRRRGHLAVPAPEGG